MATSYRRLKSLKGTLVEGLGSIVFTLQAVAVSDIDQAHRDMEMILPAHSFQHF